MQQIINFIIRNKNFLLFVLLFTLSLFLTIQSHSYHKSKFINSSNIVFGGIYDMSHSIKQYFDLKKQNKILVEENNRLKSLLYLEKNGNRTEIDSSTVSRFKFKTAEVIKNSYGSYNNFLTIDIGSRDGIKADFGVITSKGIVGIVDATSNKFSRVMSVLNTKSRINAQLKKTNHIGILKWDGKSPELVQLEDMPKQAPVVKGDTIVTGGLSTIFPKGIGIGSVVSFELDETGNYYILQVRLFNDMTNLGHVNVIENLDIEEIQSLDQTDE